MHAMNVPLSILDLAPIVEGADAAQALSNTLDLARHAERLGYKRYWLAEHHNMDGVASSATAVLIGHVAAGTRTIRVGSGGVMLPNHAPLVIAEQFGTLATLFPGRIDLGLGRAPGTDPLTMHALRRHLDTDENAFLDDVRELQTYLGPPDPAHRVRAVPGIGTQVPIWLLGSSLYSAQAAALLGLPFAFASHFAPALLHAGARDLSGALPAVGRHGRSRTRWSASTSSRPTATTKRRGCFTSLQQRFLGMQRGRRGPLPRPVERMDGLWSESERLNVERMLAVSAVGSPASVAAALQSIVERTGADELIVATAVHDHAARIRSYELLAQVARLLRDGSASLNCTK